MANDDYRVQPPISADVTLRSAKDELTLAISRWSSELRRVEPLGVRSTLWYGIMQKCCSDVEIILSGCAAFLVSRAGSSAPQVIQIIGKGKPQNRFTIGQQVRLIRELHLIVAPRLGISTDSLYPENIAAALDGLVWLRNGFIHGRVHDAGTPNALQLLSYADALCNSELVSLSATAEGAA